MKTVIQKYPLASYFVLAYVFAWIFVPLISISLAFGFLALFGPAFSAMLITYVTEGSKGLKALWGRALLWKVKPFSYIAAVLLPPILVLFGMGIAYALGTPTNFFASTLGIVTGIFLVGEELGWRGYALPRLLATKTPMQATLILGVLWAFWHLPNFLFPIQGVPPPGPFPLFMIMVIAYSFFFTWLYIRSKGSVLIATLFHASINAFTFEGIGLTEKWVIQASVWTLAVLILVLSSKAMRAKSSSDRKEMTTLPTG